MIGLNDRKAGFYWISINGQEAEVAQWQAEWATWLVVGKELPLTDEAGIGVVVLSACLAPPPPRGDAPQPSEPSDDP